jgi:hypothetical protein
VKWKLMLATLPLVAAVLALKTALGLLGFEGLIDFGDVGVVLTSGVFLIGFLLAGTMADYKEAEKLPAEISSTLETLEEIFVLAATNRPALALPALRANVLALTDAILDWLYRRIDTPQVFAALTRLNTTIRTLEREGAGPYASRAVPQLLAVRRNVARVDVIARTGFLPAAYALLEVLAAMVISVVLIARFANPVAEVLLVTVVSLINLYMLKLIRDIDNPFDYARDGAARGAAEVSLFPLEEYRERLAARVGEPANPATGADAGPALVDAWPEESEDTGTR